MRQKTETALSEWQDAIGEATRPPADDVGLTRKELAAQLGKGVHKIAAVIDRGMREGWIVEGRRWVQRSGGAGLYPTPVYRIIKKNIPRR